MAYTELSKIKSQFRSIDILAKTGNPDNDTAVTEEEVAIFISEAESRMDAKLKPFYVLPIVGTESLKILSLISTYFVAHRIKMILELTSQMSDKEQEVQGNLELKAEKMLNELLPTVGKGGVYVAPEVPLPDAVLIQQAPQNASIFNAKSGLEPTFKKGGDNW